MKSKYKLIGVIVLLFLLSSLSGCKLGYDDFMTDYDATATEMIRIVNENPTKEGTDKALDYLHKSQPRLKEKMQRGVESAGKSGDAEPTRLAYGRLMSNISARFEELQKKYPALNKDIEYLRTQTLLINR